VLYVTRHEGTAVAWVNRGQGVRIGIEVVYDSEGEEEDLIEKDSDDVMPIHSQKGTKGKARWSHFDCAQPAPDCDLC